MQGWKDEYLSLVEKLSLLVSVCKELVKNESGGADNKLKEAHEHVSRLKDIKKNFNLELRLIKDRNEKKSYEADASLLDSRVSALVKELRSIQEQQSRTSLLGNNSSSNGNVGFIGRDTKGKGNDELLVGANSIQDKTFESLNRTTAMIAESQELGQTTIENLNDQARQISDIDAEINIIDSNLKRAEKLITNFSRRMATDKIIQAFAALNIVVMIVLIAYVLISGKSLSSIGSVVGDESAGPSTTAQPTVSPTFAP